MSDINNQTYYQLHRTARLAYQNLYYIKNRAEIRIYQNNYLRKYYYRKKMSNYLRKGREKNHQIYLRCMAKKKRKRKERKKERKKKKLMRKYWDIWYNTAFAERNRILEMFTLSWD